MLKSCKGWHIIAYPHTGEAWQLPDRVIDEVGAERFPVTLKLIHLQLFAEQFGVSSRSNHIKLPLKHDPSIGRQHDCS